MSCFSKALSGILGLADLFFVIVFPINTIKNTAKNAFSY